MQESVTSLSVNQPELQAAAKAPDIWQLVSPSMPCPICWGEETGCKIKGDRCACRKLRRGNCIQDIVKNGVTYYVHRLAPEQVWRFITTLFRPNDIVLLRPVEIWKNSEGKRRSRVIKDAEKHVQAWQISDPVFWDNECVVAKAERANQFYGACPRVHASDSKRSFDYAFQIRVANELWIDCDNCSTEEVRARCEAGCVPLPTVLLNSGSGSQAHWRLTESFLIDDAGEPPAVLHEWVNGKRHAFYIDRETGDRCDPPFPMSAKALKIQSIIAGIAQRIGGDHTTDLSRPMRLPGTMNRKFEFNGRAPLPSTMVECVTERRYPLSVFEPFAVPIAPAITSRSVAAQCISVAVPMSPPANSIPDDEDLLRRAWASKRGARFGRLWAGDISDYQSHSHADLALCSILAFWTGPDEARIDRLFRQSGLCRDKWLRRSDYRQRTIATAIAGKTDFHTGSVRECNSCRFVNP